MLVKRSTEDLRALIHNFTVLERETKVGVWLKSRDQKDTASCCDADVRAGK